VNLPRTRSSGGQHEYRRRKYQVDGDGGTGTIDTALEVVTVPVSDVERAKRFYQSEPGMADDLDIVVGDAFRAVQLATPTQSDRRSRG
jgi:hypothetical protein